MYGLLRHTAEPAELFHAIRSVANGRTYLQPSIGAELARWFGAGSAVAAPAAPLFSLREREVLRLVALGRTNTEIARECGARVRTIESDRARILEKLGQANAAHPSREETREP